MKIVIVEDESFTAEDLKDNLLTVNPEIRIVTTLNSVANAIAWFKNHEHPDLIFSDIQLGDGLSFEIFQAASVSTPVIFCTAFDEYAVKAFKANGIDYILKPFDKADIAASLKRYRELENKFAGSSSQLETMLQLFKNKETQHKKVSVLVYYKDKILPVRVDSIAVLYLENKITHLITFDQKSYAINKPLEELEKIVGIDFFRANRQFLIHRNAVKEAAQYFARSLSVTLSIPFNEKIKINKAKVPEFLDWLAGE
ncbi:LytTR family DNA-binding domain-containing protein [Prolixibacter sp. NT017]|uniref:LytR/AlgR family response regulator transcription factor n=1 Tax=Prolixibacter sp. NT017 TaxID=2652390 RepID=UPI0012778924|nr:LytTR family DNA-binding domain-containing protein [Prolixibacter sp. NT017]GET25663.1 DNA-binding response regulator [Prolixibacter sp. NT017]